MEEITLRNGIRIKVRAVPPYVLTAVQQANPLPPQDDSAFEAAYQRMLNLRSDMALLYATPEVEVPESWEFPEVLEYAGVEAKPGELGRKLDYIHLCLLEDAEDIQKVLAVMYGHTTEGKIEQQEEFFRTDGG